jgi:Na+/proline symporter
MHTLPYVTPIDDVVFLWLQYFSQQSIVRASERFSVSSYQELVLARFGPWACRGVALAITVYLLGNCVVLLHLVKRLPSTTTSCSDPTFDTFVIPVQPVCLVLPTMPPA